MRSKTENPCLHQAVVEIRGIPFCEACAREQEAYFAVGELTQETQRDAGSPQWVSRQNAWPWRDAGRDAARASGWYRRGEASRSDEVRVRASEILKTGG
jgi:hypothetical protein